jgi:hypothetical protein
MDPLVATVIAVVAPYLAKGAEEFSKSAGKAAFDGVKALAARLAKWWTAEPVAEAAAKNFSADPRRYSTVLAQQLAHDLERDPAFAQELRQLLTPLQPVVEVIQRMEFAQGVTGADVKELVRGSVRVEQVIGDARQVTGFKADRIE